MREILFRGKRVDNGEWIEGHYVRYGYTGKENDYIVPVYASDLYAIEVIPETVGQYTGLTDKNGKKIFEGDIVQRRNKELLLNNIFDFKIVFIPVKACFTAVDISGGNVTFISDYINNKYDIEVIGNIHDNPELLDGVRNG